MWKELNKRNIEQDCYVWIKDEKGEINLFGYCKTADKIFFIDTESYLDSRFYEKYKYIEIVKPE